MKKSIYLTTSAGRTVASGHKQHGSWKKHPPRKDGPEPVHSRYHRRIAPAHNRKKAA